MSKIYGIMEYWTNSSGWSIGSGSCIGVCSEENYEKMRNKLRELCDKEPRRKLFMKDLKFISPEEME